MRLPFGTCSRAGRRYPFVRGGRISGGVKNCGQRLITVGDGDTKERNSIKRTFYDEKFMGIRQREE